MNLTPEQEYVVFVALHATLCNMHTVEHSMTKEQWNIAETLFDELDKKLTKTGYMEIK